MTEKENEEEGTVLNADDEEAEQIKQMEAEEKAFEEEMRRMELEAEKELREDAKRNEALMSKFKTLGSRTAKFEENNDALVGNITSKQARAKDARSKDISSILDLDTDEITKTLAEAREKSAATATAIAAAENHRLKKLQDEKATQERQRWAKREAELARQRVDEVIAATNAKKAEQEFIPQLRKELGSNRNFQAFRKASLAFKKDKMDAATYLKTLAELIDFRRKGMDVLEALLPGLASLVPSADHRARLLHEFSVFAEDQLAKLGSVTVDDGDEAVPTIPQAASSSLVDADEEEGGSKKKEKTKKDSSESEEENVRKRREREEKLRKEKDERLEKEKAAAHAEQKKADERKREAAKKKATEDAKVKDLAIRKGRELARKKKEAEEAAAAERSRREKAAAEEEKRAAIREREATAAAATAAAAAAEKVVTPPRNVLAENTVIYSGGYFTIRIPEWDKVEKKEVYLIRCEWKGSANTYASKIVWDNKASFSQLKNIHKQLVDRVARLKKRLDEDVVLPQFPSDSVAMATGKHIARFKSTRTVEDRRQKLETYLEKLIHLKGILAWKPIESLLRISTNIKNAKEDALRKAREQRREAAAAASAAESPSRRYLKRPGQKDSEDEADADKADVSFEDDPLAFLAAH